MALAFATAGLPGCAGTAADSGQAQVQAESVSQLPDGTYACTVTTDSSMFHAKSCTLEVTDGAITAHLTLPGQGFSRLFFGKAEEAAGAPQEQVFDYYLNEDGDYTFDLPVSALDEELDIAAFGHRRDTWYDHTICFQRPDL